MKNNSLSITAFAVVIFAVVATLATIAFSEGIRKVDWMDLESTAWACFGLSILGCVLGWCAIKRPLGKLSAILGSVVVAGILFQLLRDDAPGGPGDVPDPPSLENVTELTSWRNHTEQTVRARLGQPIHTELYTNGVPNYGVSEFVEDKVKRQHPDYEGAVKHLRWFSDPNYYDIFFIDKDNQWIVIDGHKWHKEVVFSHLTTDSTYHLKARL